MARIHATAEGDVPFSAAEEAARDAEESAWAADATKRAALVQIAALEASITPRMLREGLLAKADLNPKTGKTAKQDIADIDAQIVALRAVL